MAHGVHVHSLATALLLPSWDRGPVSERGTEGKRAFMEFFLGVSGVLCREVGQCEDLADEGEGQRSCRLRSKTKFTCFPGAAVIHKIKLLFLNSFSQIICVSNPALSFPGWFCFFDLWLTSPVFSCNFCSTASCIQITISAPLPSTHLPYTFRFV